MSAKLAGLIVRMTIIIGLRPMLENSGIGLCPVGQMVEALPGLVAWDLCCMSYIAMVWENNPENPV